MPDFVYVLCVGCAGGIGCSVTVTVTKAGAAPEAKARKHATDADALDFARKVSHCMQAQLDMG